LVWGAHEWLGRRRIAEALAFAAAAVILIACTVVTRAQLRYWRNSASLWNRVVQVATDVPHTHMYVAYRHLVEGDIDLAIERANMARELQPENWQIHGFLGMALARKGSLDEAIESLRKALALNPDSADLNSGIGDFLWQQGKIPAANKYYAEAARLEPHSADGQYYQGTAWHREGKLTDAVRSYQEAIRLAPDRFLYYCDLALALEDLGDRTGAVNAYRVALDLDPEWPSEWARQAWLLATHPDPARRDGILATRRARQACSISHFRFPPFLESLAAAHAEAGLFKDAVAAAVEARRMADEHRQAEFVDRLDRALKLYRNGQPFRDASLK
jgi:tetratricopeptide (TPR) repeat protein